VSVSVSVSISVLHPHTCRCRIRACGRAEHTHAKSMAAGGFWPNWVPRNTRSHSPGGHRQVP
jgi:hypothetical protein